MWPKKNKDKPNIIAPGKSAGVHIDLPRDATGTTVVIQYGDDFGNEYETKVVFDLKNKKIVKQEYRVTKKVKEFPPGDEPKLVIDENSINWPDI